MSAKPRRKTTRKTTRTSTRITRKLDPVRAQHLAQAPVPAASKVTARSLREQLGMTRPVFARIAGVSERTVAGWESGSQPSTAGARSLSQLRAVVAACERVVQADYVGTWLVTPNEALGGLKAIECIERGETERVLRVLFFWEAGIPL